MSKLMPRKSVKLLGMASSVQATRRRRGHQWQRLDLLGYKLYEEAAALPEADRVRSVEGPVAGRSNSVESASKGTGRGLRDGIGSDATDADGSE